MKSIRSELSSLRLIAASRACKRTVGFLDILVSVFLELGPVGDLIKVLGLEFADLTLPGDRREPPTPVFGLDVAAGREGGSGKDLICSGPVDLMKSAKSLVTPLSILASRGMVGPSLLVINIGLFWKLGFVEGAVVV